jgi:hypothetical protein
MDEARAREILGSTIELDDSLMDNDGIGYVAWPLYENCQMKKTEACLDGDFTADQLEAIAWWMRNK